MRLRRHRKRLVRLHLAGNEPSIEGILAGRIDGLWVMERASVVAGEGQTVEVGDMLVPASRILFAQVLAEDAR